MRGGEGSRRARLRARPGWQGPRDFFHVGVTRHREYPFRFRLASLDSHSVGDRPPGVSTERMIGASRRLPRVSITSRAARLPGVVRLVELVRARQRLVPLGS